MRSRNRIQLVFTLIILTLSIYSMDLHAVITSVTGLTLNPAGQTAGSIATVNWTYINDYQENENYRDGHECSAGIYYYMVVNQQTRKTRSGKLFLVNE
jgi:hypothetical protein